MSDSLLHVEVTAVDIAAGERGTGAFHCPVALALQRALGAGVLVGVGDYERASLYPRLPTPSIDRRCALLLPDIARDFARAFDAGRPVAPFAFDVDLTALKPA